MTILFFSFLAGILTVASPCILPILPVILGGSLSGNHMMKVVRVLGALGLSVILFTLLLKVTTWLIDIPTSAWGVIGGIIITFLGLTFIFPKAWTWVSVKLGFERSQELLTAAGSKKGWIGDIALGAALGPVFSSCSPTYAYILFTVLPANFAWGTVNLVVYTLGMLVPLAIIAFGGQWITTKLRIAADPNGKFRKILGLILVLVGVLMMFGLDKKMESYLVEHNILNATQIEYLFPTFQE